MALDFPSNPSDGDTYSSGGVTFEYSSTAAKWIRKSSSDFVTSANLSSISSSLLPSANETYDLGSSDNRWAEVNLEASTIYIGGVALSAAGGTLSLPSGSTIGDTSSGGETVELGSGAGVSVVATIDDLPGSPSAGDEAFVTGNSRLYFYTGSAWFNIALINQTPTISGASTEGSLESDGTATTVTLTATDPEGFPITWSATTSGVTSAATVTNVDNVFTITPSTNLSDAGIINVTFRASDGVNVGTATTAFTLSFLTSEWANANFSLGTSSTASEDIYTFKDRSSNAHTISTTGSTNLFQSTQTPYSPAGMYSIWIAANEYMRSNFSAHSNYSAIGTSEDFTIELFLRVDGISVGNYRGFFDINNEFAIRARHQKFDAAKVGTTSFVGLTTKPDIDFSKWHHIALCRDSGTTTLLIDGAQVYQKTSDTNSYDFSQIWLGKANTDNEIDQPKMYSNIRVVKGNALYTDGYTVPTEPLTAITGTAFLFNGNNYADSVEGYSIFGANINDHNHQIVGLSPFNTQGYDSDDDYGSVNFTNGGSYLTVDLSGTLTDGIGSSDDFTFEFWIKNDELTWNSYAGEVFFFGVGGTNRVVALRCTNRNQFLLYSWNNDLTVNIPYNVAADHPYWGWVKSGWNHVAIVKNGNNRDLYFNGVQAGGDTNWGSLNISANDLSTCKIGSGQNGTMNGSIADFALTMSAKYTEDFTPPTEPIGASGTTLYLPFDAAGIFDKAGRTRVKQFGDITTSTTQTKHATTSVYFDGTGDYIQLDNKFDLHHTFTFETWIYSVGSQPSGSIFSQGSASSKISSLSLEGDGQLTLQIFNTSNIVLTQNIACGFSADTWHHLAVTFDGTAYKIWADGTLVNTTTTTTPWSQYAYGKPMYIGNYIYSGTVISECYIEGLQILDGVVKYTSNFTPPTSEQGSSTQLTS